MPPRICVVGSANVDLTFRAPRLPRAGETLAGREFHRGFGGKGANQAVAAAQLGAKVAFVARVGDDAFGSEYRHRLEAEGLDVTYVRSAKDTPTGTAAILVDDAAQNCIVVVGGANALLTPQDVRDASKVITSAEVLLCQLEVPLESTHEAFRIARAAGVRTVLNPAPAAALPDELLALTSVLIPNETELELLTRRDPGDLEAAATALRTRGVGCIVVTLGERGAFLLDDEGATSVPAIPVAALDPTGAGDAFTASLAVGWASGQSLREAARLASAAAALTVTRLGTQAAFPTRAEVEALLSR